MSRRALLKISIGLLAIRAFGQTSFDAASVKLSQASAAGPMRFGPSGGPGSSDPGFYECHNCTAASLILEAWNIQPYQLTGPAGLDSQRYDVSAKVPVPATRDQLRAMLQNLLEERFKIALHRETRDLPKFELVVAKGGPKLKQTQPGVESDAFPGPSRPIYAPDLKQDRDGFPILPAAAGGRTLMLNGQARTRKVNQSMEDLALWLTAQAGKPVTDATGLKGRYDFTLSWAVDPAMTRMRTGIGAFPPPQADIDNGPTLPDALQQQLGLKLDPNRGPVTVLVMDHIEKTPTDN